MGHTGSRVAAFLGTGRPAGFPDDVVSVRTPPVIHRAVLKTAWVDLVSISRAVFHQETARLAVVFRSLFCARSVEYRNAGSLTFSPSSDGKHYKTRAPAGSV